MNRNKNEKLKIVGEEITERSVDVSRRVNFWYLSGGKKGWDGKDREREG